MAQALITSFEDFEPTQTTYGAPRTNARGGKSIKIMDERKNTLILSTPIMLSWGVNKMIDENTDKVSYTVSLQFPSSDYSNDDTTTFLDKLKVFENNILDDCTKNSKDWFGRTTMSREVAEALYTPILKYPKDKNTGELDYSRPPTLRVKVPYWEGKFSTELYDMDGGLIFDATNADEILSNDSFESLIPKTSHLIACIQCNGLWFAAGKFGVTWKLVQSMVKKPVRIQGGCFLKPRTNDLKKLDSIVNKETTETETHEEDREEEEQQQETKQPTHKVEDSDEENDEEEHEPEPVPVKKTPAKRKVVKKIKKKTKE